MDMQRPSAIDGSDLHPQLTPLERSGSGYDLHLILSLSANRAASVLGRDLASYRLRRGPIVHVFHPFIPRLKYGGQEDGAPTLPGLQSVFPLTYWVRRVDLIRVFGLSPS
jgi:hypothetical protein